MIYAPRVSARAGAGVSRDAGWLNVKRQTDGLAFGLPSDGGKDRNDRRIVGPRFSTLSGE